MNVTYSSAREILFTIWNKTLYGKGPSSAISFLLR